MAKRTKKPAKEKAVTYLRVSTRKQIYGSGISRQRENLYRYARAHDIDIKYDYIDDGVSGTLPLIERPALKAALEDCIADSIKLLLVENTDRLGRDQINTEVACQTFVKAGIRIIITQDDYEITAHESPNAKFIRTVMSALAELNAAMIRGRTRIGWLKAVANGWVPGAPRAGKRIGEEETVVMLKKLCGRQPDGRLLYRAQIAEEMNRLGYRTRKNRTHPNGRLFVERNLDVWLRTALDDRTLEQYRREIKFRELQAKHRQQEIDMGIRDKDGVLLEQYRKKKKPRSK